MSQVQQIVDGRRAVLFVRAFLWSLFGIALIVALATLIDGTLTVVKQLAIGQTPLTLVAIHTLPPGTDVGSARIVQGDYESASVVLSHLSPFAVALATISLIAGILTIVTLAILVALLAWRLLHHTIFRRSLAIITYLGGFVLAVGGMVSQSAGAIAGSQAALELNGAGRHGFWPLAGRLDPTMLGVGVVLLLVGLAFEYGERLQRDTEGLV